MNGIELIEHYAYHTNTQYSPNQQHLTTGDDMQTVYTQRAGGRQEYWTFCGGERVFISKSYALRLIAQGERLVELA